MKPATKLKLGYCLLHGDFHPMGSECWNTTTGFYLSWAVREDGGEPLPDKEIKEKYDAEVERKMLYDLSTEIASGMWG